MLIFCRLHLTEICITIFLVVIRLAALRFALAYGNFRLFHTKTLTMKLGTVPGLGNGGTAMAGVLLPDRAGIFVGVLYVGSRLKKIRDPFRCFYIPILLSQFVRCGLHPD